MDDKRSVIVIGRQFGSGGREIGRRLAALLGHDYFDRELLKEAAERNGFSSELFADRDERRPSALRSLLHLNYGLADNPVPSALSAESIYKAQSEVIRCLGMERSCIFVGRTADYVLREHPHLLSVFIHAPLEERCRRIIERGECSSEKEAAELARRMDRKRADYYNYYTGRTWGASETYDLAIDASRWDLDDIVRLIADALEGKCRHSR